MVALFTSWVNAQAIPNLTLEVVQAPGRTPLIFIEVPSTGGAGATVLMYGHLDKQPPMTSAWTDGLAGERQRPGGFGSITRWTLHMPAGVAPGPDLKVLQDQGLLTLGPSLGPKTAWTIEASRIDCGPPRRFRLPDCTWED